MKIKQNIRKIMFFVAIMLIFTALPVFAQAVNLSGHWAEQQISDFIDNGFVPLNDDGLCRPDDSITRAEFIYIANRAFGLTEKSEIKCSDVPADSSLAEDVAKAKAAGYLKGNGKGEFRPDDPVSRLEAAKAIAVLLRLDTSAGVPAANQFKDAAGLSEQDKAILDAVIMKKYFHGYDNGTIRPSVNITRAEAVVVLYRALTDKPAPVAVVEPGNNKNSSNMMPGCKSSESDKCVGSAGADVKQAESTQKVDGAMEDKGQVFEGVLIDKHCFSLEADPAAETKMCLQMAACEASGYGVAVKRSDGTYEFYQFDADGHNQAKEILNQTAKSSNIIIVVNGVLDGEVIKVSSISEK
ncbi:MAG: Endo-1,4-beta-xylanase A precursor [Pelotomaculum sp. PtaU1.Bin035]|nr:MAG: Endo-1,4-beta-xylanase A precursor [Pelotomaculum sp. PtaU1.Bin035]